MRSQVYGPQLGKEIANELYEDAVTNRDEVIQLSEFFEVIRKKALKMFNLSLLNINLLFVLYFRHLYPT